MPSLKDAVRSLIKPKKNLDFDPDDIDYNNNSLSDQNSEDEDKDEALKKGRDHYIETEKSLLRRGIPIEDPRYFGSKKSRSELDLESNPNQSDHEDSSSDISQENESDQSDQSDQSDHSDHSDSDDSEETSKENNKESEKTLKDTDETYKDVNEKTKIKSLLKLAHKNAIQTVSQTNESDANKGKSLLTQISNYELLLDARIKIQKALAASNTLPLQSDKSLWSDDTPQLINSTKNSLLDLISSISTYRTCLLKNELSVTDDSINSTNKRKYSSIEECIDDTKLLDNTLNSLQNIILDKWSRKNQISSGLSSLNSNKFKALNQSASVQVNTILADKERLIKRARINRSGAKLIDAKSASSSSESNSTKSNKSVTSSGPVKGVTQDPYVFDDTDFYRLLLKDLVDRKMVDSNSNSNVDGIKWDIISNSNPKQFSERKAQVDTRASKGRKLRYNVQEKIQNFMAPLNLPNQWSDEQADELFSSLLGQAPSSKLLAESESDSDSENENNDDNDYANLVDGKLDDIKIFG